MEAAARQRRSPAVAAHHHPGPEPGTEAVDHTRGVPSRAAIGGHLLHPIVVPFPIAFFVGALATDLGYWGTRDPFWARASLGLLAAGFVTGVVAAGLGLIDFSAIARARVHRIGWVHAIGNAAVLTLALVNWLLRRDDPAGAVLPWGLVLSAAAAGLLGVTGWTGGELVFRHMVGVTGHGGHVHPDGGE